MADVPKKQSRAKTIGWSGAGFAIGFAIGYVIIGGIVPAIILAIALAMAMSLGAKEEEGKS